MSSAVGVSAEEELGSASHNEQGEEQHHPKRRVLSKRLSGPPALWCFASGSVGLFRAFSRPLPFWALSVGSS